MTEDRFSIDYVTNDILDNEDYDEHENMGVTFYNCEEDHIERLCKLLNCQDKRIKQLEDENERKIRERHEIKRLIEISNNQKVRIYAQDQEIQKLLQQIEELKCQS